MKTRIILAGGSGFIGSVLADYFSAKGMEVVIFTRKPSQRADATREVRWDGESVSDWLQELEGARALINLSGISVNCRYHARNRKLMLDSRLNSTHALGEAIGRCANPPPIWLNSSTATIYKHTFGPAWDEGGEIGGCAEAKDIFSVHIATEWERVFSESNTPRTRKVALRSAMVLGRGRNSVLPNLVRLSRIGLGGSLAGGRQFVSWIHQEDFCHAVEWIMEHETLRGPVNLAAPNPVTNAEFMATIRKACRTPFGLPASRWMLEIGAFILRSETELVIKSRRVVPGKLLAEGFVFRHPHLLPSIQHLISPRRMAALPPPKPNRFTRTMNTQRQNLFKGVALGTVVGVLLQLGGYLLVRGARSEFGWVMFVLVPFVSGFAVSAVVRRPKRIAACCMTGGIITFSVMLFMGWEGIICCAMSSPLVAAGVAIGAFIGYKVRGRFIDKLDNPGKATLVLLLFCPLFIAAADRVERPWRAVQRREVFTTETTVAASPERAWELVAEMDKLDGPRPFLLRCGLPTPTRCELTYAGVGGQRVCYFNSGVIAQEVTAWERPAFMGLRITESTLPGRHWLTFVDASYELSTAGTQTRVVRHTTIGTRLYPRWYWRPLERWGVTSEHNFVFANLHRWTVTNGGPP
ncbi:MAG TPA: TIGR01777 family oxidoreductase [Verrucomicrobiae bacterium]